MTSTPAPLYSLNTPLGEIQLHLRIDGQIFSVDDSRCTLSPVKIDSEQVEGAFLFSLQIHPHESIQQLQANCRWADDSKAGRGKPESYPGKNVLRWNSPSHCCVLATEDVDSLRKRKDLPASLQEHLEEIGPELDHLVFVHRDDGMTIRLSDLKSKEPFRLLFMLV